MDEMNICVKNLKKSTKKILLELISDYSKIARYKIKIKKNQLLFYIPAINKWNLKLRAQCNLE